MPINIYTVTDALEEKGWKLVSNTYKNLKTPLQMICPKGHEQEQTFETWRKTCRCEKCFAANPFKQGQTIPPKSNKYRILALDAATNITGWAIFDDKSLVGYGTYKTNAAKDSTQRINECKYWLKNMIRQVQPDFIGIENIQLQSYNGKTQQVELYRVLANLQGVILDTIFEENISCALVYSTEWRELCGISGKNREEKKKNGQQKVHMWYNLDCTEDEADAICIGKYFANTVMRKET